MANNDEMKIEGLAELHQVLQGLPAKIERNIMRGALRAGTKIIKDQAVLGVPVDEGNLKKSIRIKTSSKRGVVRATVAAGKDEVVYASYVEFGTSKMTPRPFMRPALDSTKEAAIAAAVDYIKQRLDKELSK